MNNAFWTDAFTSAIKAEIKDLFLCVFATISLWRNSLENIRNRDLRFAVIISIARVSLIARSVNNAVAFLITIFIHRLVSSSNPFKSRVVVGFDVLVWIRNATVLEISGSSNWRLDQGFQHIDTLTIKRSFFMAFLADNSLNSMSSVHWYSCFSSSQKLICQRHNWDTNRGYKPTWGYPLACIHIWYRLGVHLDSFDFKF